MWFLKDLGRLNRERSAINALEAANDWLDGVRWHLGGQGMVIDAEIVLGTDQRAVRLRFPEHYPSVPPSVRPQEPALWSTHQYGANGDLCLELGPDNWHPDAHTAADMLQSTHRLLTLEAENEGDTDADIPSRHALTDGQRQRFEVFRWVATPATFAAMDELPDGAVARCALYLMYHERTLTAFMKTIEREGSEDWMDPQIPKALKRLGRGAQGVILSQRPGALTLAALDSPATLTTLLEQQSIPAPTAEDTSGALDDIEFIILKGLDGPWQAHWRWPQGGTVSPCSTLRADTSAPAERHDLDTTVLSAATVAIVGLGSAGSKIATSLARSGVEKFVLLDDDLLHPANLVRHDSDWSEVGQHKVDAIVGRIALINPNATVDRRLHRLNGQESSTSAAAALTALGKADLIIDATANPNVFSLCAHVAVHAKASLLWLSIYAGGIGGLVARARADKDPQPFTLRSAISEASNAIAEEKDVEPPEGAEDYAALDGDDRIVFASDADVTIIAGHAVQMALDTLLEREPSHFQYPAYLVGFRRGWVFEQPFHIVPIECTADPDWSTLVDTDKATRDDAAAFVVQLLEDLTNDTDAEPAE